MLWIHASYYHYHHYTAVDQFLCLGIFTFQIAQGYEQTEEIVIQMETEKLREIETDRKTKETEKLRDTEADRGG